MQMQRNRSASLFKAIGAGLFLTTGLLAQEAVRVDASGNVGIGTSAPSFRLHLADTTATSLNVSNTLYAQGDLQRVGIGTPTPSSTLDVQGSTAVSFSSSTSTAALLVSRADTRTATASNIPTAFSAIYHDTSTANRLSAQTLRFVLRKAPGSSGLPTAFDVAGVFRTAIEEDAPYQIRGLLTEVNVAAGKTLNKHVGLYVQGNTGSGTVTQPLSIITEAGAGNAGIGTVGPVRRLEVEDKSADFVLRLDDSDAFCDIGAVAGNLALSCVSDRRVKTDVEHADVHSVLADLAAIKLFRYRHAASGEPGLGPIAQELEASHPNRVRTSDDGILMTQVPSANELLAAIQALSDTVERLTERIATLETAALRALQTKHYAQK